MSLAITRLGSAIEVVTQSLVYGLFIALMPIATTLIIKQARGLEWRLRTYVIMLAVIWAMFTISTAFWVASFAFLVAQVRSPVHSKYVENVSVVMTAIGRINYGLADAVLLWRVWVICKHQHNKLIGSAVVSLFFSAVFIIATICVRLALTVIPSREASKLAQLTDVINILQVATLFVSFCTNFISVTTVGFHVWTNWQAIYRSYLRSQTTNAQRVVVLLTESGIFYTIYVVMSLICTFIRVPTGTLGDVTNKVLVHIAGVYSTFIITMVSIQGTVNIFTLSDQRPQATSNQTSRFQANATLRFAHPSTLDQSMPSITEDPSSMLHGRPDSSTSRSSRSSWKVSPELMQTASVKSTDVEHYGGDLAVPPRTFAI